jgi:hypothetical protein
MDESDKFDLILKKLEENEKRIRDLERMTNKESDSVKKEEKFVKTTETQENKLSKILEKLEATEEKIKDLENRAEKDISSEKRESFFSKKNSFLKLTNWMIVFIIIIAVAVISVLFVWVLPGHVSSQVITTSGQFFLGPIGTSLGQPFINGLSNASSQSQAVAQKQLTGSIQCNSPSSSTAGFCVLVMSDNNYDIIPIRVPANFSAPSISQGGKITFVYIGAQGCPYCAQERWAIAVALSNFGNFTNLFYDRSATNDGSVPTFLFNYSSSLYNAYASLPPIYSNGVAEEPYGDEYSTPFFEGAYYNSSYIKLDVYDELISSFFVNTTGLPSNIRNSVLLPAQEGFGIKDFTFGGVPFFDMNNQYTFDGATVAPILCSSSSCPGDYTQQEVLSSIQNPVAGSFGEIVLGAANILTAQICVLLNNAAPVCKLSYIQGLQAKISNSTY